MSTVEVNFTKGRRKQKDHDTYPQWIYGVMEINQVSNYFTTSWNIKAAPKRLKNVMTM